ncbi:MAG: glycosyltransferase family 4 protein, partial [Thermoplasmata archaeon]|nr:glycosyltransferase family 4 protein [Thermoplasmata archaeon]
SQKPVVLSDIPGVRDVIDDGKEGLRSRPTDPKDIAEKVNTLIDDPELRLEMGERGRKRVLEKFSWDVIGKRYREIYERMLDSA